MLYCNAQFNQVSEVLKIIFHPCYALVITLTHGGFFFARIARLAQYDTTLTLLMEHHSYHRGSYPSKKVKKEACFPLYETHAFCVLAHIKNNLKTFSV